MNQEAFLSKEFVINSPKEESTDIFGNAAFANLFI